MERLIKNADTGEIFKSETSPFNYTLEILKLKQDRPDFFKNPEAKETEICIMNDYYIGSDFYNDLPFQTKRKGKVATNRITGEVLSESLGLFPIFVDVKDYIENKEALLKVQSDSSGLSEEFIDSKINKEKVGNN